MPPKKSAFAAIEIWESRVQRRPCRDYRARAHGFDLPDGLEEERRREGRSLNQEAGATSIARRKSWRTFFIMCYASSVCTAQHVAASM
jgi:hypothetical protein